MLTGKNILVTGGAGFIGSNLCERLVKDGNNVTSLDNYFTGSKDNHKKKVTYIEGHTKNIKKLIKNKPDIIFHLGEYARVEKSFDEPNVVFDLNTSGTIAVIEFCRKNNIKLVYAGSSTKFADDGKNQSPYAFTKAMNTELIINYGKWFGLKYAITYFYNVYGGNERGDGNYATLIGIFKKRFLNKEKLFVVSPGTQVRNFTHVEDTVEGLIIAGEKGDGDGYGIGASEGYSVIEVAKMFKTKIEMLPERKGNRSSSRVCTDKIKSLGWKQKHELKKHIKNFLKENS